MAIVAYGNTTIININDGEKGDTGDTAQWFYGTALTHTTGTATMNINGAVVGSMYLNTETSLVYKCTDITEGVMTWTYAGDLTTGVINNIQIGGRNLLHNTNVINLSPTTSRPNINGDSASSGYLSASSGSFTAATHGARITNNSAVRLGIIFGSNTPSASGTHGLAVGREYTFSCDWETKTLSGSPVATTTYYLRAYLYYATSTSASSMTSHSFATWHTFKTSDTSDRNAVISGHGSFTFTVPEDAAVWNIRIYSTNISTASLYAVGDYLQIENVKLEEGNKATAWTPAPEDVDKQIDNIQVGGKNLLTGTNSTTELTATGYWADHTWRAAGSGTGTTTAVPITDCPDKSITRGWQFNVTSVSSDAYSTSRCIGQNRVTVTAGE